MILLHVRDVAPRPDQVAPQVWKQKRSTETAHGGIKGTKAAEGNLKLIYNYNILL